MNFFPFVTDFKRYKSAHFRADLKSALTVALLALPQSMTYSLIADLPASVGIFSVIFGTLIASTFCSSSHLMAGPTNAIALLLQTGIANVLFTYYRDVDPVTRQEIALSLTCQLTLMIGVLQILAGVFQLGKLTQFVSRSVVTGYIAGAAIAVMINQCYNFSGIVRHQIPIPLFEQLWNFVSSVGLIHFPTLIVGLGSLCLLLVLRRFKRPIPDFFLMIIIASISVWVLRLSPSAEPLLSLDNAQHLNKVALVRDTDMMGTVFPLFSFGFFNIHSINMLLPIAFALAMMSVLEMNAVTKSVAVNSGQHLNGNQDIFGLGMGNFVSSFVGAMPSSGSPSRTYLSFTSGAKTRFSGIYSSVMVLLIMVLFAPLVKRIPLATLAALLCYTAYKMVNIEQIKYCLKSTKEDATVLIITVLSCLIFAFDTAFYIGVVLSISFYLRKAATPYLVECTFDEVEGIQRGEDIGVEKRLVRIVSLEGEFFFASADVFQSSLRGIMEDSSVKVLILNLRNARDIDATACIALKQLHAYLEGSNRHLLLCNVPLPAWKVIKRSGLINVIEEKKCFLLHERFPNLSVRQALVRAAELLKKSGFNNTFVDLKLNLPTAQNLFR